MNMLFQAALTLPRDGEVLHAESALADSFSPPVPKSCHIEIVTARARFDELETEWNSLFERAARADQLFQNFNWLWHWANHFLNDRTRLRIIAGWSEGRLVMVWPLAEVKTLGLRKLVWMGEPVSQYGDALVEPGSLAQDLLAQGWAQVRALGADFALLRKTRAASSAGAAIADAICVKTTGAPVLEFGNAKSFEDVLLRLSPKARSSRRRLARRLMESGDVCFSNPAQKATPEVLIRHAFNLKRIWLEQRGRYSPAIESDSMLSFFIDAASSEARPVEMPIDAIYCGAQPIGIAISLSCKGGTLGHIIAHDSGFEKQGVGIVLTEHVLRSSFERGCSRFDMLAPQDAYKMEWTDQAPLVHDWIMPFTLAGRLYVKFYVSGLGQVAMNRMKNLPPSMGRVIWPMLRRFKKQTAR